MRSGLSTLAPSCGQVVNTGCSQSGERRQGGRRRPRGGGQAGPEPQAAEGKQASRNKGVTSRHFLVEDLQCGVYFWKAQKGQPCCS